jgi:hypothetical protein
VRLLVTAIGASQKRRRKSSAPLIIVTSAAQLSQGTHPRRTWKASQKRITE